MIKIFDCSNSVERYKHSDKFGRVENEIIFDLKIYANRFGCEFVDDYTKSDVLLTNDIFPSWVINLNIPKVKRMDGIYWQTVDVYKNELLNKSAEVSDYVIFISKFSQNSLHTLYPEVKLKNETVILNSCDSTIYYNMNTNKELSFSAMCTNWNRQTKRFKNLIEFAKNIEEKVYLLGNYDKELPSNVFYSGYIEDRNDIKRILNLSTAHINLSYRDAAPKTVCQAVSCGLPVLYADSGGVGELIKYGVKIKDEKEIYFDDEPYELDINDIMNSYYDFKNKFLELREKSIHQEHNYMDTMNEYFNIIKKVV